MKQAGSRRSKRVVALVVGVGLAAMSFGCADTARMMRRATYPPDFQYISDAELESVMWRLAGHVHALERLTQTAGGTPRPDPDAAAMARVLDNIEREARALESEGSGSTHPYFAERLETFLGHVTHAQRGLRRDPPVLTSADEVWRACAGCHNRR